MRLSRIFLMSCISILAFGCQTSRKETAASKDLIPREAFFGNPDISRMRLSPDGKHLAYIAERDGILNVWVQDFGKPETARAVTQETKRGIFRFDWTYNPGYLLFPKDVDGDENFGLYLLNIKTGETSEILKPGQSRSHFVQASSFRPKEVIVQTNQRDPKYFDYMVLNLETKKLKSLFENKEALAGVLFDHHYNPVLAVKTNADASQTILQWNKARKKFLEKAKVPYEDAMSFGIRGISLDGNRVFLTDSRGQDKAALKEWNVKNGLMRTLAESERSDIIALQLHPKTSEPLWAVSNYLKSEYHVLEPSMKPHIEFLKEKLGTEFTVSSMNESGDQWIVVDNSSERPYRAFFYEVKSKNLSEPIPFKKALNAHQEKLVPMEPVEIPARDGMTLVSFLTRSKRQVDGALVLLVHGGPWSRDLYGFDPSHQWLANRGYNVLSVNFRGSSGLGKKFINAGDLQWGRKMHDDLLDAVKWAVDKGHAKKDRVVIMGGSYGGYAALAGLTFSPETFGAAVDIVGPSNLETLLQSVPPYWESMRSMMAKRVGDLNTEEGRALLRERSPLTHVNRIKRPLLILQGAMDPRVKKAEADQIYNAMVDKKIPVEYVLFPDEGHGFAKAANSMGANAIIEGFLKTHLGGALEPMDKQVKASSAQFITEPQKIKTEN